MRQLLATVVLLVSAWAQGAGGDRSSTATASKPVGGVETGTRLAIAYATAGSGTDRDPWVGFESCIIAAAAGETCKFGDGYFSIGAVEITTDRITVLGGGGTTLTLRAGTNDTMFYVNGADGVTFRNLSLRGNKQEQSGAGYCINADNGTDALVVARVECVGARTDGFRLRGKAPTYTASDALFDRAVAVDANGFGFKIVGALRTTVVDSRADSNGASGFDIDGFSIDTAIRSSSASGNADNGFFIEEGSRGTTITNGVARANLKNGLNVNQQTAYELRGVAVLGGRYLRNAFDEIRVSSNVPGAMIAAVTIDGVAAACNGDSGVELNATAGATLKGVSVRDSLLMDSSRRASQRYGLKVSGAGRLSDNVVGPNYYQGNVVAPTDIVEGAAALIELVRAEMLERETYPAVRTVSCE